MSKRCKLQKEYYKEFGNYKGYGKYTDHYVNWLESKVLAINCLKIHLVAFFVIRCWLLVFKKATLVCKTKIPTKFIK